MKLIKKLFVTSAIAMATMSAFATSSQTGLDPAGDGVIHVNGTAVSSCAAPTLTIALGSIDMHTSINGANGTHEEALSLPVTCTNPTQNWTILPAVSGQTFTGSNSGSANSMQIYSDPAGYMSTGATQETVYVAVVNTSSVAGNTMAVTDGIPGVGTQTVAAKAIFGKDLPSGTTTGDASALTGDPVAFFTSANLGIPTGTVDGRGALNVTVPLIIMY